MFLDWSLVTVNIILAVFQFLLIGTIGAILAIYSRLGSKHANSIRWVRQGGYPEMLSSVYNSWKRLPDSTKIAIVLTLCASLCASLADKGAAYFITIATRQTNGSVIMVNTSQFLPFYDGVQEPSGWTVNIRHGVDIVEAMARKINDTSKIPNAMPGRVYIPQTSAYEGCNQLAIRALHSKTPQLRLTGGGCMDLFFVLALPYQPPAYANSTVLKRLNGRWSIVVPTTSSQWVSEIPVTAMLHKNSTFLTTMNHMVQVTWMELKDGITTLPQTVTSKGVSSAGETLVLSISSVPFSTSTVQRFRNVSAAVFDNYNDMFAAMEASVNNATLRSRTNLFIEVKVSNPTVEVLACYSSQIPGLMCAYIIITSVVTKQQPLNPILTEARQGRPLSQLQGNFTIAMRILHTVVTVDGARQSISTSVLKDATTAATHYLASLGQNFYMDWNASQLYVIYDTTDIQTGLEVPLWLIWGIAVIMITCLCLWAATEYFMDERYLSSLQKNIAIHLGARLPGNAPMVMRSKFDPLEFEDVSILSYDIQHEVDK
ncbi:hypothetical protein BGZ70_008324 [Mortierella alpina]|uniref:Transmembrane protein n=1 Tax=Mortierella alpina TaxID=64518 RepID=A0A9P6M1V1_MORAP|nr:hypothetical protein BGZ70_008324 [Mortierella alpina]